jgi:hypothetical protein
VAEWLFKCPAHDGAAGDDNGKIYMLLEEAGIPEQDHPARMREREKIAHELLEKRKAKAIASAEHLIEHGRVDDASEFLGRV